MTHTIRIVPVPAGPFRKHQARCTCRWRSDVTSDLDDAKRAGEIHVAGVAHERVVGEVAG